MSSPKLVNCSEVDHALLVELEHREEAHDHLEPVRRTRRRAPGSSWAPTSGSRRSTDSTASRTLARTGATWSVSTTTTGGAASARSAAARSASGFTRSSGSGASERSGSSGPAVRGTLRSARRMQAFERLGRVLERLALEQARQQQVALLEAQQLLVELEVVEAREQAAGLELHQRRRDEQELGGDVEVEAASHALELGEVGVDDRAERDLPELHLLLEDEVQQEVERALEHRGADRVRHRVERTGRPTPRPASRATATRRASGRRL